MKPVLTFFALVGTLSLIAGCDSGGADIDPTHASLDPALGTPTMLTYDVSMLVSDSGVIRYHATTPLWLNIGQKADEKYQYFPEGIHIVKLDSLFQPTASIDADTAYNFERKQLWRLVRNVVIRNLEDEEFHTSELYWDMKSHTVYSDSFIHIERPDATVIEGFGFSSNDDFSRYEIRTTSGIFPMSDLDGTSSASGHYSTDDTDAPNGTDNPNDTIR